MQGTGQVKNNIADIFARRQAAVYALSQRYAELAIQYFRSEQGRNAFWINQTHQAMNRMDAKAYLEDEILGWFMAHGVEYGPDLELKNNGRHQAIKPVVDKFSQEFFAAVKELF